MPFKLRAECPKEPAQGALRKECPRPKEHKGPGPAHVWHVPIRKEAHGDCKNRGGGTGDEVREEVASSLRALRPGQGFWMLLRVTWSTEGA